MKPKWLLSRRKALLGVGSISIGLPLLDAMIAPQQARAQAAAQPRRFIGWYHPGGTALANYLPTGGETDFTLSPILAPLEAFRSQLLIFDGLGLQVQGPGHQHARGIGGMLTGQPLLPGAYRTEGAAPADFAAGPSIDQVIAQDIASRTQLMFNSIELGVGWPSEQGSHPYNILSTSAASMPLPPTVDPTQVFTRLFGQLPDSGEPNDTATQQAELRQRRRRSVLDGVIAEYSSISQTVGSADRMKLEAHLEKIREIELSLGAKPIQTADCKKPSPPMAATPDWQSLPALGNTMMDLMVMALACDLTRVGTFTWNSAEGAMQLPFIDLPEHIHGYQHESGKGLQLEAITKIHGWFMTQLSLLLQKLSDQGLLDSTTVFSGTDVQEGNSHVQDNMPYFIAGGGGYFRTGRYLRFPGISHNNLLVSVLNSFGMNVNTFGDPAHCTGPLTGLV